MEILLFIVLYLLIGFILDSIFCGKPDAIGTFCWPFLLAVVIVTIFREAIKRSKHD